MRVKRWLRGAACALALFSAMQGWILPGSAAAEPAGPIPEAVNLIANGGFETGTESPWGKTADLFYVTDEKAYKGQYSYKLQGRLGELDGSWPNQKATVPVEAGTDYLVFFHALSDFGGMEGDPRVAIKVVPSATSSPTLGQVEITKAQGDGTWKRYSFPFNSGELTAVRVYISEHGGIHYFDEFAVIEAPASIRAPETSYTIGVGGTASLEAIAEGDEEVLVTAYTAFESSDPEVVRVDADGTVRGLKEGTATITMTCGSASAQVEVVVSGRELTGLRFSQSVYDLTPGASADTVVEAVYGDGDAVAVTDGVAYLSGNPGVAEISANGRIEAISVGTAVISAFYGGQTATAVVRVAEPADPPEELTIQSPLQTVEVGQSLQLTALAVAGGETIDVTASALWTVEDESAANVSLSGELTATAPGWTVVQATYGGVTASLAIAVNGLTNGGFENAASSPWTLGDGFAVVADAALARTGGKSLVLQGSGTWKYARQTVAVAPNTDYALIWHAVSDFSEAAGTVPDPKVTVKITADSGTLQEYEMLDDSGGAWRRHSFLFNSGANGIVNLYISEHGGNHRFDDFLLVEARELDSIRFEAPSYEVPLGGSARTVVTGQYAYGLTVDVTRSASWSVDDTGVAKAGSGLRSGVITGEGLGVTKAKATLGGFEAETEIHVVTRLAGVRFAEEEFRLTEGASRKLSVIAEFLHGGEDVTEDAVYESSDPGVAAVGPGGTVTGVGYGTATIRAEYGGYRAEATVVVNMLIAEPGELVLRVGQKAGIAVYRELPDGSTTDVTAEAELTIADPGMASLSNGQVLGLAVGETELEAAYGGHRIVVPVRVVSAIVAIEWDEADVRLLPGGERAATVRAVFSDGRRETIDPALIDWSSGDPDVASIDADGRIRAQSPGTAILAAKYETLTATATIRVVPLLAGPPVWTDAAGDPVSELAPGAEVHAHAELSSIEPSGAIFVLALYDRNGSLVGLVSQSVEASPEAAGGARLGMRLPDDVDGMRLQWMAWSDWESRVPLAPASALAAK